ncbi:hypothetical protein [Paenibacillus sp. PL2-23]|uniref:hypothetical protein n=1 Tax=Paenibacillus sp. PL2-23 TaxID=2100729 RepID=UPI0030FBE751
MFIKFYLIYVVLSALALALVYSRSWQEGLMRLVIVTVFPAIGWLFPILWPKNLYRNAGEGFHEYITQQQMEHKDKVRHISMYSVAEADKERNVIPIEEALLISEHQTRRRIMIDVLKRDSVQYLEILQTAVSNEDTETSHYAVSAIMEVKRKLLIAIQELSVQYEANKKDVYVIQTYAEVLKSFLRSGFLDQRTYTKYQYAYLELLTQYTQLSPMEEWAFREKVEVELELQLYAVAEATCIHYLNQHPASEQAYLSKLKVHYTTKSAIKLEQTLEQLKQSPVKLSNHALTMVRFWSEGA